MVMVTRAGKIKKTELTAFSNVRASGIIAIDINEGDDLYAVRLSDGDDEIFIGTHDGRAIRFNENGRPADGPRRRRRQRRSRSAKATTSSRWTCSRRRAKSGAGDRRRKAKSRRSTKSSRNGDAEVIAIRQARPDPHRHRERLRQADARLGVPPAARGGMGVTNIKITEKNGKVAGMLVRLRRRSGPAHHRAGDDHPRRCRRFRRWAATRRACAS